MLRPLGSRRPGHSRSSAICCSPECPEERLIIGGGWDMSRRSRDRHACCQKCRISRDKESEDSEVIKHSFGRWFPIRSRSRNLRYLENWLSTTMQPRPIHFLDLYLSVFSDASVPFCSPPWKRTASTVSNVGCSRRAAAAVVCWARSGIRITSQNRPDRWLASQAAHAWLDIRIKAHSRSDSAAVRT